MVLPILADIIAPVGPILAPFVPITLGKLARSFTVTNAAVAAESILEIVPPITGRKLAGARPSVAKARAIPAEPGQSSWPIPQSTADGAGRSASTQRR
jgi:hypothetical protein